VKRLHTSRAWIGTRGTKRSITLTFFLPNAARVVFTFNQVAPVCRPTGHISYRGHAGWNRARFNGRLGGRVLEPGTYRISARTGSGRTIRRLVLVVVDAAAPSRAELAAARSSNVCATASSTAGSTGASNTGGLGEADPIAQLSASEVAKGSNSHSGVLAAALEKTAEAIRPVIVSLLALAILLLAVAALPRAAVPDPHFHDVLARHRVDIAGIGAAAFVAVVLVFGLG
jgi:hypothetical protein